jgi:hypothetical protein
MTADHPDAGDAPALNNLPMNTFEPRDDDRWPSAAREAAAAFPVERRMEHRWGRRRPCRARVRVTARGGIAGAGVLRNVSMSGAFLETTLSLAPFTQITVDVLLDDGSQCGEYQGTVMRRQADGVGIEWTESVAGSICKALGCAAHCPFSGELR